MFDDKDQHCDEKEGYFDDLGMFGFGDGKSEVFFQRWIVMELEMTGSAITIHLETYISRQAKKITFQSRSTFYIASQQNISHFKAGKHHYHKIEIEEEHQAIVIIDIYLCIMHHLHVYVI